MALAPRLIERYRAAAGERLLLRIEDNIAFGAVLVIPDEDVRVGGDDGATRLQRFGNVRIAQASKHAEMINGGRATM